MLNLGQQPKEGKAKDPNGMEELRDAERTVDALEPFDTKSVEDENERDTTASLEPEVFVLPEGGIKPQKKGQKAVEEEVKSANVVSHHAH